MFKKKMLQFMCMALACILLVGATVYAINYDAIYEKSDEDDVIFAFAAVTESETIPDIQHTAAGSDKTEALISLIKLLTEIHSSGEAADQKISSSSSQSKNISSDNKTTSSKQIQSSAQKMPENETGGESGKTDIIVYPEKSENSNSKTPESTGESSHSKMPEKLVVTVNGEQDTYDAVDILARTVNAEMGASFHSEALKAQTIAAHSYILYWNARGKAPSLPATSTAPQSIISIVEEVIDKKIYYNGSIIEAVYSASSAGKTHSAQEIWGGNVPYLQSVVSTYDYQDNWDIVKTIPISEVRKKIESYCNIKLTDNYNSWFQVQSYTSAGAISKITVLKQDNTKHEMRGNGEFRMALGLKSAWVEYKISGENFIFTTRGYGHGVGMSQNGANRYAINKNWNHTQILTHYYSNVTVK